MARTGTHLPRDTMTKGHMIPKICTGTVRTGTHRKAYTDLGTLKWKRRIGTKEKERTLIKKKRKFPHI